MDIPLVQLTCRHSGGAAAAITEREANTSEANAGMARREIVMITGSPWRRGTAPPSARNLTSD